MAKGKIPEAPNSETVNKELTLDLNTRRLHLEEALVKKGAIKKPEAEKDKKTETSSAYAVKLSSEFLAAIIVGVVLGLGFDQLAGTNPWGLVFFLFLGFAAGIMNVLRSVGKMEDSSIGKRNNDKN